MKSFKRQINLVLNTEAHLAIIHEQCHELVQFNTQAGSKDKLILWITEQPVTPLPGFKHIAPKHARQILGQEYALVVYDISLGIRANTLYSVMGCIHLGGRLILLTPYTDIALLPSALPQSFDTDVQPSRFNQLIAQELSHIGVNYLCEPDDLHDALLLWQKHQQARITRILPFEVNSLLSAAKSKQQMHAHTIARQLNTTMFNLIYQQKSATPNDILANFHVLIAERGRGKSYLLGMVCGLVNQAYCHHILIVTQSDEASKAICKSLNANEHSTSLSDRSFVTNGINIALVAPDDPRLFTHGPDLNLDEVSKTLIMVDEAASLPVQWLLNLTEHYQHIIFATTISGYENNGLGFSLSFLPRLANYHQHELDNPIRFLSPCPIEQFTTALLQPPSTMNTLSADLASQELNLSYTDGLHFVDKNDMTTNKQLRKAIMNCLMIAHYQTSPDDLQRLLDAPDMHCYIYINDQHIVGCVWIMLEGCFTNAQLCNDIACGTRRVTGHLSVQQLAYTYGAPELLKKSIWRINRIAVLPRNQNLGYGSQMLNAIYAEAKTQHIDLITSAFGASPVLLRFWQKNQFTPIKQGLQVNAVSGRVTAIVARSVQHNEMKDLWQHIQCHYTLLQAWNALVSNGKISIEDDSGNEHESEHTHGHGNIYEYGHPSTQEPHYEQVLTHTINMLHQFINNKRSLDYVDMYIYKFIHIDQVGSHITQSNILWQRYHDGVVIEALIKEYNLSGKNEYISKIKEAVRGLLSKTSNLTAEQFDNKVI